MFDYRKAFDLIDHSILISKLSVLDIAPSVINWIIDFLSDRSQRIKLCEGCVSEWCSVPYGVPQGTKLGPWLFLIMINDLTIRNASLRIFVDNTTTSEVVKKGQQSKAQITANEVVDWSTKNRFQLSSEKCKELRISFTSASEFPSVVVGQKCIKLVKDAKL